MSLTHENLPYANVLSETLGRRTGEAARISQPIESLRRAPQGYFVIAPQAMRSPAWPAGSVFMSSAEA